MYIYFFFASCVEEQTIPDLPCTVKYSEARFGVISASCTEASIRRKFIYIRDHFISLEREAVLGAVTSKEKPFCFSGTIVF